MAELHGSGPAAEAAALALAGLAATGVDGAGLTLWVAPLLGASSEGASQAGGFASGADPARDALEALYLAPRRLAEGLSSAPPQPGRDAAGEPVAQRQLILMVERRLLVSGSGWPEEHAAVAALLAWVAEAALRHAPWLRVNVIALPLQAPPDLGPSLGWLCSHAVVTGQVVKLGPAPRSTAPFRSDTR